MRWGPHIFKQTKRGKERGKKEISIQRGEIYIWFMVVRRSERPRERERERERERVGERDRERIRESGRRREEDRGL